MVNMQKEIQSLIIQYGEEYAAKEIYKLVLEREKIVYQDIEGPTGDGVTSLYCKRRIREINSEILKLK
jgi:hypothetical protein